MTDTVVPITRQVRRAAGRTVTKNWLSFLRGGRGAALRSMFRRSRRGHAQPTVVPFSAPHHPPGVVPRDEAGAETGIAQDEGISDAWAWAGQAQFAGAFAEGVTFLGYPYLSVLAQRPEYRIMSEVLASEMTREWIEFRSTSGKDKTQKIKALEAAIARYRLRDHFRTIAEYDGYMGRSHLYVELEKEDGELASDDRDELLRPIGSGRDSVSRRRVRRGSLVAFRPVEAVWCYPTRYDSNDPLKGDWYQPTTWFAMGKEVHITRFLTFVGRPVPDLLKPAYSFGGLSLTQMAKPYVDNWLRTRQSVSDLVSNFSTPVLSTVLAATLEAGGEALFERAEFFNDARDNQGLMMVDKETEEYKVAAAPLGSLDALQAQSQEHMFSVSQIPGVKFAGIQPAGLNASSEGEIRSFYDTVHARQERFYRQHLTTAIDLIQLSEYGEIDEDLEYVFKSLWQLDDAGRSAIEKEKTDIDEANVSMGAIGADEVRRRLCEDQESIYAHLDLDSAKMPEPPEQEGLGEESPGYEDPGGSPGSGRPESGLPEVKDRGDPLQRITTRSASHLDATGGFPAGDEREDEDYLWGEPGTACDAWLAAADDAEGKENSYPRDASGKFATASGPTHVKHAVGAALKAHGYAPKGMSPGGHHVFEHPGGSKLYVGPATPSQGGKLGVTGFSGKGVFGQGAGQLSKHLESVHGKPAAGIPAGGKTSKAGAAPKSSGGTSVALEMGLYKSMLAEHGFGSPEPNGPYWTKVKGPGGAEINIANKTNSTGNFAWDLTYGEYTTDGTGSSNLEAALDIGKNAAKKPAAKSGPVSLPMGAKVMSGPKYDNWYVGGKAQLGDEYGLGKVGEHEDVRLYVADSGDWAIVEKTSDGSYSTSAHGSGQESLDSAFEALHPRGPGGKFVAKSGGELAADTIRGRVRRFFGR